MMPILKTRLRCLPIPAALLGLLLALPVAAQDRPPIKTGLWQIQPRGAAAGALPPELADKLARLDPETRRKFEAMMKSRAAPGAPGAPGGAGGAAAAGGAGGASGLPAAPGEIKVCFDEETFRKDAWNPPQPGCTHEIVERGAQLWRWRGQCSAPPSTLEGESRFDGATAFSSTVRVTLTRKGRTSTQEFGSDAKWLGADCKGVPPLQKQGMPPR